MPAWWSKKLALSRKPDDPAAARGEGGGSRNAKEKARSFDEALARRAAAACAGSSTSSSGFDSDGAAEKRGHPLPRPSPLSPVALAHLDPASALASASASASSAGSSGSSDETPDLGFACPDRYGDPLSTPRAGSDKQEHLSQPHQMIESLQHLSIARSPCHPRQADHFNSPKGELVLNGNMRRSNVEINGINGRCRSRSPGPTPGSHSPLSSPMHPRLSTYHPDTDRQDEMKIPCHPLPLPPGSPSPSSPSHSFRYNGSNENGQCLRSKWRKGKLLGRGTFGHVYVGFNSENGHMCAIKEVRVISDDQNSRESLRQLNQEIVLLSQLSHPNIVQYYGSELAEESLSVYLEYVSGGSIHKLLQDYGPFGEPVIRSYARQILSGLAYLHERNTVHRDIKGANILVDPNGEIKLADFGMAKHINSCTNVLSFKGSPYWMAPEVIMNTNGYNLAVDIWSLGCTILEMATSKPPWSQYEGVAAIFKIGNSKSRPEIPDHISDDGKNFVTLCLQRDPSARPTAAQLLEHPFVKDHVAKVSKINITKELHPFNDKVLSPRGNPQSDDADYGMKDKIEYTFPIMHQRDEVHPRVNMSLPVSPCSSPLRQFGAGAHRNYFLSPPHPAYVSAGSGFDTYPNYPLKNAIGQARKQNGTIFDVPLIKPHTPGGSPRVRDLQSVCL